jgi:hypothetical protein
MDRWRRSTMIDQMSNHNYHDDDDDGWWQRNDGHSAADHSDGNENTRVNPSMRTIGNDVTMGGINCKSIVNQTHEECYESHTMRGRRVAPLKRGASGGSDD